MIHVFAFIRTKPGMLPLVLDAYRTLVPKVMANELGCLEYIPTIDFDSGLPNQEISGGMITVSERWKTIEDFRAHLNMPHCISFRSAIKGLLDGQIAVKITQNAL